MPAARRDWIASLLAAACLLTLLQQKLSIGNLVVIPKRAPWLDGQSRGRHSWMQCVGHARDTRSCHFRNICMRLHAPDPMNGDHPTDPAREIPYQDLFYYTPSKEFDPLEPGLYGSDAQLEPFLATTTRHAEHQGTHVTPRIVYEPIPEDARWSESSHAVYLAAGSWPDNYAHSLGDDYLPAFSLAKMFGFPIHQTQAIFHPSCHDRQYPNQGCEHHGEMSELLFGKPPHSYHSLNLNDSLLCFENLAIGSRSLAMYDRTSDWPDLADAMKDTLGVKPYSLPKKHQIVVMKKTNRRMWTNEAELVKALRDWLDPIPVIIMHPEEMHFYDQIRTIHDTTVFVSPCGGVSFVSMFLPKGTSAIFSNFWSIDRNESRSMESYIYQWHANIHNMQYTTTREEYSYDDAAVPEGAETDPFYRFRNYANLTINTQRMARLVLKGIEHGDQSFGIKTDLKRLANEIPAM